MPEKPLICLGEAWLELEADTAPELAGQFAVQVGGWGAALCRAYARCGGPAVLLSQLGADPFGRKIAARLAADGVDCSRLCFTGAARTAVVFCGTAGEPVAFRAPSAEQLLAPEQLDRAAFRGAGAFCFSSVGLTDCPLRLTHLTALAAARDAGVLCCYAPRLAEAAAFWPEGETLAQTARQFFPQADVLWLKESDLLPLFGSRELRTALFALFTGHVQLIFYSALDKNLLFTRNAMAECAQNGLTEAEFLHRLVELDLGPGQLPGLRQTQLQQLLL